MNIDYNNITIVLLVNTEKNILLRHIQWSLADMPATLLKVIQPIVLFSNSKHLFIHFVCMHQLCSIYNIITCTYHI